MKQIEKDMQRNKLSVNQRIKKDMLDSTKGKNVSDKDVQDKVFQLNQKKF